MAQELPIPPELHGDRNASELIRVWKSGGGRMHYSLMPDAFPDAAAWGILLADVLRLVADALGESCEFDRPGLIEAMRGRFDSEMDHPTDDPEGKYLD
jgi:hypothetical protein